MVSEETFPKFWGVLSIQKWSLFFVSVIGSAISEISQFARIYTLWVVISDQTKGTNVFRTCKACWEHWKSNTIFSERAKFYPAHQTDIVAKHIDSLGQKIGHILNTEHILYGRLAKYSCNTIQFKRLDTIQQFEYNDPTIQFRVWNLKLHLNFWTMILYNILIRNKQHSMIIIIFRYCNKIQTVRLKLNTMPCV